MAQVSNTNTILQNESNSLVDFKAPNYNHVTVVQVEETERKNHFNNEFVTVLQVGDESDANHMTKSMEEEIIIYRLPGERLGMALKFEGGTNASEKINKVFIQNINTDSPASKARGQQLEFLKEGDQIMQIDGKSTSSMTRLECIGLLRDAPVCIKTRVKRELSCHFMHSLPNIKPNDLKSNEMCAWNQSETINNSLSKVNIRGSLKKVPPPVPPRMATTILSSKRKSANNSQTRLESDSDSVEKPPRKKSLQPPPLPPRRPKVPPPKPPTEKDFKSTEQSIQINGATDEKNLTLIESQTFRSEVNDLLSNQMNDTNFIKDKHLEENRFIESILPSEPSVYLDLFADEDIMHIESESDDTGSSVSTIIERFSRTSTANSSFSDNTNRKTSTIDMGRVLSPFENLERELDHKEALQAFVNKAAAVLIADQDLREITKEGSIAYDIDIDNYCDSPNPVLPKTIVQNNPNVSSGDQLSLNVQIIVPPEEFSNQRIDSLNSGISSTQIIDTKPLMESTIELKTSLNQNYSKLLEHELNFGQKSNVNNCQPNDSTLSHPIEMEDNEDEDEDDAMIEQIVKDIDSIEKETKLMEDIIRLSDTKIDLLNDCVVLNQKESNVQVIDCMNQINANVFIDEIDRVFGCIENDILNISSESTQNIDKQIEETEYKETFHEFEKQLKLTKGKMKMKEDLLDLLKESNIDEPRNKFQINNETESRRNHNELEEKQESASDLSNICTNSPSKGETNTLTNTKLNGTKNNKEREILMHSHDSLNKEVKNSSTISLIPKRVPTIKPRKAKSYGNIPALYISPNTHDKKPSLIPRPVSKNSTPLNNKLDSVKKTNSHNVIKVQNSKIVINSKLKTPSERKKSDVLSHSFEAKMPLNLKSRKSQIKCDSLMDLTTNFTTTDITNSISVDDSVERVQSPQNELLELTETNQTESSLQSKKLDNNISGTESESELNYCGVENQRDIIIESVDPQQHQNTDSTNSDEIEKTLLTPISTFTPECVEESQKESISVEESDQLNMIRVRKPHDHNLIAISMDSTCLPPTYARQPPDGREITLNYVDLHSSNVNDSKIPPVLCEIFEMPASVHEDSGVFIDNDSPSPELDFNKGGPNVAVTRIKYKSNASNSSDADTGITSMSSDSMDELDSGPLPNLKFKKQLIARSHNPSSGFSLETAPNGYANCNSNSNSNKSNAVFITKSSDMNKSVKERIAMFDLQRSDSLEDNEERKESLKAISKNALNTLNTSFKSEPPLTQRTLNYESSTLNEKNDLMSENTSSSLSTGDKSKLIVNKQCYDKNNDIAENGSIYNMKNTFMHMKSSSLSTDPSDNTSNSQQQNTTNFQYTGHLQPSYLRFSSLGSTNETSIISNTSPGIGVHKPLLNGSLLSSILETRKQNASKLKGLIIPDIPTTSQSSVSKALPTIFSNTCTSSTLLTSKPEEVCALTHKQNVHQSQSQSSVNTNYPLQRQSILSEPPWIASNNASIPKYSPAFKRRQLELPRSLSLLNNMSNNMDSPSNTITGLNANDSQFHFSLSHSKPVIPLMPETAIISKTIDDMNNTSSNISSMEEHLVTNLHEPYRHSSIQRRYSDDLCNNNINSLKFSLEKRSSADSAIPNIYQGSIPSATKKDMISMQSLTSLTSNNKINDPTKNFSPENKIRPIIMERKSISTNVTPLDNNRSVHRSISNTFTNLSQEQSRDTIDFITKEKLEYLNGNDKCYKSSRGLLLSDYSDDDSSTISHKTSEDSSIRADDSASDTASDSLDHAFNPEFTRPKVLGTQLTVLKNAIESEKISINNDNNTESVKNFRALAEKWEQRSGIESCSQNGKSNPPPLPPKPSASLSRMPPSLMPRTKKLISNLDSVPLNNNKVNDIINISNNCEEANHQIENIFDEIEPPIIPFNKKLDLLPDNSSATLGKSVNNAITSRSRSVSDICKVFECNGTENSSVLKTNKSSTSLSSNKGIQNNSTNIDNMLENEMNDSKSFGDKIQNWNQTYVEEIPETKLNINSNTNNLSLNNNKVITDIEKNFDNINNEEESNKIKCSEDKLRSWDKISENEENIVNNHHRMSSIDSIASDSGASTSGMPLKLLGQRTSSVSNLRDSQYGSVTSLASTTSLISPQELQQLIEEANQSLEVGDQNHNIQVVVLHREYKSSGSIGITLAGGSDCETKEITVHRVINGSLTDRDGRIKKGDRILSINGKILKGVTHKEALDIMKAPRPEVVIVLSRHNSDSLNGLHSRQSSTDMNELSNGNLVSHSFNDDIISFNGKQVDSNSDSNYKVLRAELTKDVAGLGFILEGGKDSPLGDKPLAIKRIFRGGPADKEGTLASGDEVISVNDNSVNNMTRTEAWNFLKKLPDGPVVLVIKRKRY